MRHKFYLLVVFPFLIAFSPIPSISAYQPPVPPLEVEYCYSFQYEFADFENFEPGSRYRYFPVGRFSDFANLTEEDCDRIISDWQAEYKIIMDAEARRNRNTLLLSMISFAAISFAITWILSYVNNVIFRNASPSMHISGRRRIFYWMLIFVLGFIPFYSISYWQFSFVSFDRFQDVASFLPIFGMLSLFTGAAIFPAFLVIHSISSIIINFKYLSENK